MGALVSPGFLRSAHDAIWLHDPISTSASNITTLYPLTCSLMHYVTYICAAMLHIMSCDCESEKSPKCEQRASATETANPRQRSQRRVLCSAMWCQASSLTRGGATRSSALLAARRLSRKHHHANHSFNNIAQARAILGLNSSCLRGIHHYHHHHHLHHQCNNDPATPTPTPTATRISHNPSLVGLQNRRSGNVAAITLGATHGRRHTQGLSFMHTLANASCSNGLTRTRRLVGWPITEVDGGGNTGALVGVGGTRKLSSWRRRPPSIPENVFVGAVILVLIGMGLLFGGGTISLLDHVWYSTVTVQRLGGLGYAGVLQLVPNSCSARVRGDVE